MPIPHEDFQHKLREIVQSHYAVNRTPLLLSHLGVRIEKDDAWPVDRNDKSLKQLINERFHPDLDIVWDKRSPAYVAVVSPDVRKQVEDFIEQRHGNTEAPPIRLDEIARPVLLAFCIAVPTDTPVYVRRIRPFRYETGNVPPDRASEFVIVESEYRRPGLRVEQPGTLSPSDRRDLEGRIQKWAAVHSLQMDQFSRFDQEQKDSSEYGKSALDRLIAAQGPDVAERLMIPADIAQILARLH